MRTKDSKYVKEIVDKLKLVSKDNAVRTGGTDEGFNVKIEAEDIRRGTGRQRIKEPILNSFMEAFNKEGFKSEVDYDTKNISIYVPPILEQRTSFTLNAITERAEIVSEINIREEYETVENL